MYELITGQTLAEYESFIASHPKGHFAQSSLWGKQKCRIFSEMPGAVKPPSREKKNLSKIIPAGHSKKSGTANLPHHPSILSFV